MFGPAVVDGRAVEPDQDMGFCLSIDDGTPLGQRADRRDRLSIAIRGVDHDPVSSYIGRHGGSASEHAVPLRRSDGTTCHSPEGHERTGEDSPGAGSDCAIPTGAPAASGDGLCARRDEVDAASVCKLPENYPQPLLNAARREETLFAEANFDRDRPPDLP